MIDQTGTALLSKRVENDETIAEAAAGVDVCWATDLNSGGAALLAARGQLLYISERIVHHAAATYRGDGKQTRRTPASSPTRLHGHPPATCSPCGPN
jgi:hypothetical protein